MPVGTGSINRAARSSKKTTAVKTEESKAVDVAMVEPKTVAEAEAAAEAPAAVEAKTATEKATEKKAAPKKTAAKKTIAKKPTTKNATDGQAAPKKKAAKKAVEQAALEKTPELRIYGNETMFVAANECCHLTEELPVHLL